MIEKLLMRVERWAMARVRTRCGLEFDDGRRKSAVTIAKMMLSLTKHEGWLLFKGSLYRSMVTYSMNADEKSSQVSFGHVRGLAFALDMMVAAEYPNLKALADAEKEAAKGSKTEEAGEADEPEETVDDGISETS